MSRGPETKMPILPSAGFADGRATQHIFDHYEDVPPEKLVTGPGPNGLRPGKALMYRCLETGELRRWGLE